MINTKTQILETARELFNKQGIAVVTMRSIADKMGISPGNVTYHFKRREELIEALYQRFVEEVEAKFSQQDWSKIDLQLILRLIEGMTETRIKYRFIMQDLLQLMNENKTIRKHYRETLSRRKVQFIDLLKVLVKNGLLRKPELQKEYELFYDRIQILGSFWIASAGIDGKKIDENVVKQNHEMILQSIYPYLSAKGKKEWLVMQ